ncbi:unnamed protein product [Rotaria sordida]|uniref:Uncharacterized protein n=1 Tax=Rotaria sordida TaxID=392033 RepID=A0A816C3V3_9BILA|nr:unnamed protein product [Rotaria sordida]CAF1618422.1 unnamed protein product [Rotaria sordida]
MPPPCGIETCKQHDDSINSQIHPLVDEINNLDNQLSILNVNEIIDKCRQKLDKWRHDSHKEIDRFYEEKYQELQQRCIERVSQKRKKIHQLKLKTNELIQEQETTYDDISSFKAIINDIKRDIDQYEENGILVDVHPLIINNNLIYIEKWTLNEIDISTLSSLYRTIDCSNDDWPVLTSNKRFLLLDQYPNLCLFDKELTIVKQCPWKYDRIPDMCWSSTLNCFIIVTNNNGIFQVNENLTLVQSIETIEKKQWLSCTCSDVSLFLTINDEHSGIFEFNLLPSFRLIKQWKFPQIYNTDEFIHNIAYNNGTLALLISYQYFKYSSSKTVRIEVRSSSTLDQLWSVPLNITYQGGRVNRICSLTCDEWLVIDHKTSSLLHINKDGQVKAKRSYEPTAHNATLFGSNILAIRTTNCLNFHRV